VATHGLSRPLTLAAGSLLAAGVAAVAVAALPSGSAGTQRGSAPDARSAAVATGNSYRAVKLVADTPGEARLTDPALVNAWGLAALPTTPLWVSDNGTDASTLYQGATSEAPLSKVPLEVAIPGGGAPTGVVANPTTGFRLHTGGKHGPSLFVFAGEDGDISAWNRTGDLTHAVRVAHTEGAVYKGLAVVKERGHPFLLAADFHGDRIDVFNDHFQRVHAPHAFADKRIPDGFAPFNVATLDGKVYVSYAKQDAHGEDDVAGAGNGFVNVYDQRGRFLDSLVRRGVLDSPWGLAVAPQGFGRFSGKLLVGNFGDGRIHVVDQRDGHVVATLRDSRGNPVVIDGLWGLLPGNGVAGRRSDVWFSAGPGDESHGLLGVLRPR
jgi:uncharacterized protein (TIGR03118 family)